MTVSFHLRRIILRVLYRAGRLFGINRDTVNVLCYHSISSHPNRFAVALDTFEREMERIASYATFVSLDDVVEAVLLGKVLPKSAVAITIDDGYADVARILPITKRLNIPITLFVLSAPEKSDRAEIGNDLPFLDWESIRSLRAAGWTIGCHGLTHTNFHTADTATLREEIVTAKHLAEQELGETVKYFAYPGGRFSDEAIALVEEAGFVAGFSILEGSIDCTAKRFILPRTIIDKTHQLSEFPTVHSQTTFLLRRLINPLGLWNTFLKYD